MSFGGSVGRINNSCNSCSEIAGADSGFRLKEIRKAEVHFTSERF